MARVLLVQPWLYGDEGKTEVDMFSAWRNAPYALVHLATYLRAHGHEAAVVDLSRDLVGHKGDVAACLEAYRKTLVAYRPDLIGFGFFSVHFIEAQKTVRATRAACSAWTPRPLLVGGGIHASIEPRSVITDIGCDYAVCGEGELALLRLAAGEAPESVPGVYGAASDPLAPPRFGDIVADLDSLPLPDWSLVDRAFYAHPTTARMGNRLTSSLDVIMGRGCAYRCAFCAYGTLSQLRFHSADYLVAAIARIERDYGVRGIYFQDSTIGTNKKLLVAFCEKMLSTGLAQRIEWLANIRTNQVDPELLRLMWRAGCRQLFYGFESGSQKILDAMNKRVSVKDNIEAAQAHEALGFPYFASFIVGYPGENEQDLMQTYALIRRLKPPRVGLNWYVPLPGSKDFETLRREGRIGLLKPEAWRLVGEVNAAVNYSDTPDDRLKRIVASMEDFFQSYRERSLSHYHYQ